MSAYIFYLYDFKILFFKKCDHFPVEKKRRQREYRYKYKSKAKPIVETQLHQITASATLTPSMQRRLKKLESSNKHVCNLCGKVCVRADDYEAHMTLHSGETPHPCQICGIEYRRKQNLISHMQKNHNM